MVVLESSGNFTKQTHISMSVYKFFLNRVRYFQTNEIPNLVLKLLDEYRP